MFTKFILCIYKVCSESKYDSICNNDTGGGNVWQSWCFCVPLNQLIHVCLQEAHNILPPPRDLLFNKCFLQLKVA